MTRLCDVLQCLSVASLGLFAGAMLTEGCVLVSYWRALSPSAFLAWYAANDQRLLGFFGPLTSTTAVLALSAAVVSYWTGAPGRWAALLAAALSLAVVSSFFLYFKRANASFAAASVREDEVPAALARWAAWHWTRTAISLVAFAAAILALLLAAAPASACQLSTDCEPGSKCVKNRGDVAGVCVGGTLPGNAHDRAPARTPLDASGTVGKTCEFHTDCGPQTKCFKSAGSLYGTCLRAR